MRLPWTAPRPSPIRLLQITAFVSTFDRFAMPPMLVAIAYDLGVPLSHVVQAAGAYFLAYGVMQPVWGIVSDSLGRVRTMRLTLMLAAVATIASAFAQTTLALGLTRCLAGAFFGAAYPASLIYLGDTVPSSRRQSQITRLMVGVAVGTGAASVGAGALAQLLTWRLAFVITGLAALALLFPLGRLPEPAAPPRRNALRPLLDVVRSRSAVLVLALAFTEGAVLLGVLTLLPSAVEATGATASVAGGVTAVYGVAVLVFASMVGRLSRRTHPSRLIAMGATSALAACAVLTVSRKPAVAIVVALLLGLAWAAMHSSLQTWATEVAPDARAAVVSLFAGSLFIGSAVAAVAVADLAEAQRYGEIFLLAGLVTIPLGLVASWSRARWQVTSPEAA
jgi:predicted MFS family arabinose efflux permease